MMDIASQAPGLKPDRLGSPQTSETKPPGSLVSPSPHRGGAGGGGAF